MKNSQFFEFFQMVRSFFIEKKNLFGYGITRIVKRYQAIFENEPWQKWKLPLTAFFFKKTKQR